MVLSKHAFNKPFKNSSLEYNRKIKYKILKLFLLERIYQIFLRLFQNQKKLNQEVMEYYIMESELIQYLIKGILETEEYTLEGIAFYTRLPFDVIYDAACGISNQFTITTWVRIINLYLKLKPQLVNLIINDLLELKTQGGSDFFIF